MLLIVLRFAARVIAQVLRSAFPAAFPPRRAPRDLQPAADMVRDPVCGTFVTRAGALTAVVGGRTEHFCSEACRDRAAAAPGA